MLKQLMTAGGRGALPVLCAALLAGVAGAAQADDPAGGNAKAQSATEKNAPKRSPNEALEALAANYAKIDSYRDLATQYAAMRNDDGSVGLTIPNWSGRFVMDRPRLFWETPTLKVVRDGEQVYQALLDRDEYIQAPADEAKLREKVAQQGFGTHPVLFAAWKKSADPKVAFPWIAGAVSQRAKDDADRGAVDILTVKTQGALMAKTAELWIDRDSGLLSEVRLLMDKTLEEDPYRTMIAWRLTDVTVNAKTSDELFRFDESGLSKVDDFSDQARGPAAAPMFFPGYQEAAKRELKLKLKEHAPERLLPLTTRRMPDYSGWQTWRVNIDDDPRDEIVMGGMSQLTVLDPDTLEIREVPIGEFGMLAQVALVRVHGERYWLLVKHDIQQGSFGADTLELREWNGTLLWRLKTEQPEDRTPNGMVQVADLNGDGVDEIVLAVTLQPRYDGDVNMFEILRGSKAYVLVIDAGGRVLSSHMVRDTIHQVLVQTAREDGVRPIVIVGEQRLRVLEFDAFDLRPRNAEGQVIRK